MKLGRAVQLAGWMSLGVVCFAPSTTAQIPNPPNNLTASAVSGFQIVLSWTDNSSNEDGFEIERSRDGTSFNQIAQVLPNTTNCLNSGLFPDNAYYYRLRAYNSAGNSAFSGVASAGTPPILCPLSVVAWGYAIETPPAALAGPVAIAAGSYHNLALRYDGTVVGWGGNSYGEKTPPAGVSNVVAIAAGGYHSLALKLHGNVVGWGYNYYGQAMPPAGLSNVVAIAAGSYHSLALKSDGTVFGWGYNGYQQTTPPTGLAGVVAVAAGGYRSLALKSDGTVVTWGTNFSGEVTPPSGLTGVVAIAASSYHSLALKSDGTVVGWGTDYYGEATPPVGLSNVVAIAAGSYHSLALKSDGTVVGWGYNGYGQTIPPVAGVAAIAAGEYQSLALTFFPNAPAVLTAIAIATNQVKLSWVDTSVNEDGFKIERALDAGGSPGVWTQLVSVAINTTNYTDSGVTTNTTYWYQVRSYNNCGDSPFSYPAIVNVVLPAAPYSVTANILGPNQVDLSWYPYFGNMDGFRVERAPDVNGSPGSWTPLALLPAGTGYFSDTSVTPNAVYWYRVLAYNAVGDSTDAYPIVVSLTPPLAPYYLFGYPSATNQIYLYWYESAPLLSGFKVERAPDNGGSPGTWGQIQTLASPYYYYYYDTGVVVNATYWYRVRSYNVIGDSPYSDLLSVSVAPPGPPTNLVAVNSWAGQIGLSWSGPAGIVYGYKIERAPDLGGSAGSWTEISQTSLTNYTDTGLGSNTTYWYRVRAYNAIGDSPYSNEASALVRDGQFVRVMQWNIEHNLGRQSNNSSFSAQAIARIINYNQPDILLFCEIDAQGLEVTDNQAALIDWVANNVPYLGTQTFYVAVSVSTDGFNRNAAISRFPIPNERTYGYGLRGLHALQVRVNAATALQVYHAHLKCCGDGCAARQSAANNDANEISAFAATNSLPYIFAGDWNEDEENPECTITSTYHPITTIREGGGLVQFKPTTLDGEYRTWATWQSPPSIRFDYILAATNRLSAVSGFVFSSMVWGNRGLYTDNPQNNYYDSYYASDHYCVFANYFFPDPRFSVTPMTTFVSSGYQGGPFSPLNKICTLSNVTSSALSWNAANNASWLSISPTNGTLAAGATVDVTASVNPTANTLLAGTYSDAISFGNPANSASVKVNASLGVQLSPFQTWQVQYFGSTDNPSGAPNADPDGDGQNNTQEFLAGTIPTDSASAFRITSVAVEGNNVTVTWMTGVGKTNALERSAGAASGSYANNFTAIFSVTNTVDTVTNFLDSGAATNVPSLYYRVRLVP
jgi:endonuclease/exonuclease/phosphatase family metal-dependent hydrolase